MKKLKKIKQIGKTERTERKESKNHAFSPDVTIIIPTHTAAIDTVLCALHEQSYAGRMIVIVMDDGAHDRSESMPSWVIYVHNECNLGLARNMNKGILMAKTEFVITLHQDCIPQTTDWLQKAMLPMQSKAVVLSSSQQIIPKKVWDGFSFWHKVFAVSELTLQKTVSEHATVYRMDILKKCGLFDHKTHHTAGEDTDIFIKMRRYGKLIVNDGIVAHVHAPHNDSLGGYIKKILMRDNEAMGVLHRKYGLAMGFQFWYDLFRTGIFLFFIVFLLYNTNVSFVLLTGIVFLANFRHINVLYHIFDVRLIFLPLIYTFIWFITLFSMWKGFISGKQGWFNN